MGHRVSSRAGVLLGICTCVRHDYDGLMSVSTQASYQLCVCVSSHLGDCRSLLGLPRGCLHCVRVSAPVLMDGGIYQYMGGGG